MSLRLHSEYGVNPTIPTCFYCGKDKNEVVLLGAAYKGEAPMHIGCMDKEPCEECKKLMSMGVMLVSIQDGADQTNPYRTGKIAVLKAEAAQRIFNNLGKGRFAFVEDSVWKKLGLPEETKEPADAKQT